jgi:integrase
MTQFRRGPNKWAAKYMEDGELVWVPGGPWKTKREAAEAEQALRKRGPESEVTCRSFAERWLEEWPREAVSTRALYAQAAQRFSDEFGDRPVQDVSRVEARSWSLGVPRNLSKIIGTLYEDARNVGLVDSNPFANLRLPKSERTAEVAPPSTDEFRQLLAGCMVLGGAYAEEFRALVTLTAWTGLRASEVMGLRRDDFEPRHLNVRRARKDDGSYGPPKGGQERRIALPVEARVQDRLVEWSGSEFAFHTMRGRPLKKGSLYYLWNKVRDASGTSLARISDGVKPIRFHDLRHFAATQWLERGASHFDVSVLLGHQDGGALVMARYGHPSREAATNRLLEISEREAGIGSSATTAQEVEAHG